MTRSLLFVLPLLVACGSKDGDDTGSSRVDDILALTGDATNGATVYTTNCESCHGAAGAGGSAPALAGLSDEPAELLEYILNGDGDMPAFDGVISDQEIADVLAYIESL